MFDFSFSELVLIGLIALIVLGPQRLPEVARAMGRWMARLRRFVEDVKRDINQEVKDDDLAAFRKIQEELVETRSAFERSAHETFSSLSAPTEAVAPAASPVVDTDKVAGDRTAVLEVPSGAAARKTPVRKTPVRKRPARKSSAQPKSGPPRSAGPKTTRNSHGGARKTRPR